MSYHAYEAITVSNTSISFTAATDAGANIVFITVETDQVRYRSDGTAPTASEGHLLETGDILILENREEIDGTNFIRVTTDATLRVSFGTGRLVAG